MCRFVFYQGTELRLSSLLTEPDHSLIRQSFDARERAEPLNGDGFGVAWYLPDADEPPGLYRSVTPAWSDVNLHELARAVTTRTLLAHVRAATAGVVSQANCHPFRRGRLAFMHNGDIGGFHALRRPLLARLSDPAFDAVGGSTDSEHFFALIHDALDDPFAPQQADDLVAALRGAIASTRDLLATHAPHESLYLNAVLTDGDTAVVCRYTDDDASRAHSLYRVQGRRYDCVDGVCHLRETRGAGSVLVASEPLSADGDWQPITPNHALVISGGEIIAESPLP